MLFTDFIGKLKQCNPRLWVDVNKEARSNTEFPTAGLYLDEKFVMGVPHQHVPEYSIAQVNFKELERYDRWDEINKIKDTGFATEKERIVWRGWRIILHSLINMKYIRQDKAEKVFHTTLEPKRTQLPRTYIQGDI